MLFVHSNSPDNTLALEWLRTRNPYAKPLVLPSDHPDAYYYASCHPEIVEVMWDSIAPKLPLDTRCLVYGTPCLLHPVSGVLLSVGMGTQYCVRILPNAMEAARDLGCTAVHTWSGSDKQTDLRRELGLGWVFGSFDPEIHVWCQEAFQHFAAAPPPGALLLTQEAPALQPPD